MIELLRDPFWQFVGAFLAFATIVITILIFLRERSNKEITYQVISFSSFLTINEEEKGDFRVLYKGRKVQDLSLITLKVSNTGNVPITINDYDRPISFNYGVSSRVLSAEIIGKQPVDLPIELSFENNKVTLSPALLNSGDVVEIKCIVTSPDKRKISAECRIVGVKKLIEKRINLNRYAGWILIGTFFSLISWFGIGATVDLQFPDKPPLVWLSLLSIAVAMIGFVLYMIGAMMYLRHRGRKFINFVKDAISAVISKEK